MVFALPLCADPCHSSHVGNVTLTICEASALERHLFISTTDLETIAFRIAIRTDGAGAYSIVENEGGAAHVVTKIKGKLFHVTVTELHTFTNAAFSIDNGTLPHP